MRDSRINFRSRELAAMLAFLVPGAGHFYQGRNLKAGIFFCGILSLFFGGMILGDWQPVYSQVAYAVRGDASLQMQSAEAPIGTRYSIGYAAQVLVGLPAVPSLIQQSRFSSGGGVVNTLKISIDSDFVGGFSDGQSFIPVSGQLILAPQDGGAGAGQGSFEGLTTRDGEVVSAKLSGSVRLGRPVFGSPRREFQMLGLRLVQIGARQPSVLQGTISRSFTDWYQAPRDNAELDRLHSKLSQNYDIACVFTWIAGLLNLMAMWDAYGGPAYGYGDDEPEGDEGDDATGDGKAEPAVTSATPV